MNNRESWIKALNGAAFASLALCILVSVILGYASWQSRRYDPLDTAKMDELLLALNRTPKDEKLRAEVHQLDLKIRNVYFQKQAFTMNGFYILIGGIFFYFVASEVSKSLKKSLPSPNPQGVSLSFSSSAAGRRSVAVLGLFLGGGLITLSALSRHDAAAEYAKAATKPAQTAATSEQPQANSGDGGTKPVDPGNLQVSGSGPINPTGVGKLSPDNDGGTNVTPVTDTKTNPGAQSVAPSASSAKIEASVTEKLKNDWPVFRGPTGVGIALSATAPTSWSATQNVLWKSPIPLPGWNSPIVIGKRVFISGGTKTEREVYCYDADLGATLWKRGVPSSTLKAPSVNEDTGYAPSTLASDGSRVFAIFPNGDLICFDLEGKQLWRHDFGMPENVYGHAASLALYGNGLIVQIDQGMTPEDKKSHLFAIDCATGKPVWSVAREVGGSWSTPIVVKVDGKDQIITASNPLVISYDPATGKEIWRANCMGGDVSPSAAFGGGNVLVANLGAGLFALKPNLTGDITKTGVSWKVEDDIPDIVSLLSANDLVYMLTTEGTLTCVDVKTGKKVWSHAFENRFNSSPLSVAGKVYVTEISGKTHILDGGSTFKELGTASVGEDVRATLAVVKGKIYIRGKQNLFCIGEK